MYVILTYDVADPGRLQKTLKYLRRYLNWIQNSAFEGELSVAKLAAMKSGLEKLIDTTEDSVLIWTLRDVKWLERETMGVEKAPISTFI